MKKMSGADTAWLRMDEPTNLMMITGILVFEERLSYDDLRAVMEERLLRFERFRQRVVWSGKGWERPYWIPDPAFRIEDHLHRLMLPAPGGKAGLQKAVSRLMSAPLDFSKPLWHFHFVEDYDGGSALIARLHHCMADGFTLVRILLSLTDEKASEAKATGGPDLKDVPGWAGATPSRNAEVSSLLRWPGRLLEAAQLGAKGLGSVGKLLFQSRDPDTVFRGSLSTSKRAVWSEPISLAQVKEIGKLVGGTVNDVLLATATGALRRYMLQNGDPSEGMNVRAAVPVNLRSLGKPLEMGNKFGLVFISLPVGIEDPIRRFYELKRRMDKLKGSPEALVVLGLLHAVGTAMSSIQEALVEFLASKITAVATNVPGPREKLHLAGAPLGRIMFWVPQAGRVGLGLSIISYAGEVAVGTAVDASLVPDPEKIVEGFQAEFEALRARILS